jgi:hypothetical protein
MDIQTVWLSGCDRKRAAQEFCRLMYPDKLQHFWTTFLAVQEGSCALHPGRQCSAESMPMPDLSVQGLPCQPWTQQRVRNGQSAREQAEEMHPDYGTVMDVFARYPRDIVGRCLGLLAGTRKLLKYLILHTAHIHLFHIRPYVERFMHLFGG